MVPTGMTAIASTIVRKGCCKGGIGGGRGVDERGADGSDSRRVALVPAGRRYNVRAVATTCAPRCSET